MTDLCTAAISEKPWFNCVHFQLCHLLQCLKNIVHLQCQDTHRGSFFFDLALNHVNEATVSQDGVGPKNIEEVWEVGNSDSKVSARLNLKLILHRSPAPATENRCIRSKVFDFTCPLWGKSKCWPGCQSQWHRPVRPAGGGHPECQLLFWLGGRRSWVPHLVTALIGAVSRWTCELSLKQERYSSDRRTRLQPMV